MHKSTLTVIGIIVIILIATGIFFGTRKPKQTPKIAQENVPTRSMPSAPPKTEEKPPLPSGARPSGGPKLDIPEGSQPFFGTVSNLEEGNFSIKSPMGESNIIFTESTVFEGGSSSDLKNDISIGGYGTKNTDGTITALQIQINPSMPERGQFPSR